MPSETSSHWECRLHTVSSNTNNTKLNSSNDSCRLAPQLSSDTSSLSGCPAQSPSLHGWRTRSEILELVSPPASLNSTLNGRCWGTELRKHIKILYYELRSMPNLTGKTKGFFSGFQFCKDFNIEKDTWLGYWMNISRMILNNIKKTFCYNFHENERFQISLIQPIQSSMWQRHLGVEV